MDKPGVKKISKRELAKYSISQLVCDKAYYASYLKPEVVKITQYIKNEEGTLGYRQASGFFITNKHVLTCNHCVPKLTDGEKEDPISIHQNLSGTFVFISYAVVETRWEDEDIAVLRLDNPRCDVMVADLESVEQQTTTDIFTIGYPVDERVANVNFGKISAVGLVDDKVNCSAQPSRIRHKISVETTGGTSGSPIYLVKNQNVIGLLSEPRDWLFISMKDIVPLLLEKGYINLTNV